MRFFFAYAEFLYQIETSTVHIRLARLAEFIQIYQVFVSHNFRFFHHYIPFLNSLAK